MKKRNQIRICVLAVVLFLGFFHVSYGTSMDANVSDFLNKIKDYQNDFLPELSSQNIIDSIINGNMFAGNSLLEKILRVFTQEIKNSIKIVFSIIAVSLLCSILKNIQSSFGRKCE